MELVGHTVAERYEIIEKLQSGYFGQTWLAVNKDSESYVCLKTFFTESHSQQRELSVLKQLCEGHFEHENVCKVLDICGERAPVMNKLETTRFHYPEELSTVEWDVKGQTVAAVQYVVFEFCRGSDLFNFLCTGPWERTKRVASFSEPLARHYFKQAVLGVMYLHERGVFHRDIKPENCVIDDNLNLKLTDFGTNKIFPESNPMQLLRTKTRGVGTESYRAPEVNSGRAYDPSAADVWSLGVMLFFFVGIEQMWSKAQLLDPYVKQVLAPLGIFFPFPVQCAKLESYLRREPELRIRGVTGSIRGDSLANAGFWSEWVGLRDTISQELRDLFNRIFVMEPAVRITLRDILRHPWMNVQDGISPEFVQHDMLQRCPHSINMPQQATPKVVAPKQLGGVDTAVLRDTLSGLGREELDFPEDSKVWVWGKNIEHLESIQLHLIGGDLQELIMDIGLSCELINDILKQHYIEKHRTVYTDHINAEWIAQLLLVLGFLPHGHTLFLPDENLDLSLLNSAVILLKGVEFAIMRSAMITSSDDEGRESKEDDEIMEMESELLEEEVDNGVGMVTGESGPWGSLEGGDNEASPSPMMRLRSESQNGGSQGSHDAHIGSSQGSSVWASMSSQSSQEELPESMQLVHDWFANFSDVHQLIQLHTLLDFTQSKQFKAASEFCKISGLLCSYGLYQAVCHEQLVLYCRGSAASFSVRLVQQPNPETNLSELICKACISSWCFSGTDEWIAIFERLRNDL